MELHQCTVPPRRYNTTLPYSHISTAPKRFSPAPVPGRVSSYEPRGFMAKSSDISAVFSTVCTDLFAEKPFIWRVGAYLQPRHDPAALLAAAYAISVPDIA
eukprot:1907530-Rhodomonas_salina.1